MAKRRFKAAKISFLSLCPAGANKLAVIYKDDDSFEVSMLSKSDMDLGEVHCCVYAPELRDSQGDIASAEVIKSMAYDAARDGLQVDIRHDGKPVEKSKAFVAESFIIQKGDNRFTDMKDRDGNTVDVSGGWGAVIKINDRELREKYRTGQWSGVSMGGVGDLHVEKSRAPRGSKELLTLLARALGMANPRATHHTTLSGEVDMDQTQLNSTLATFKTDLMKDLAGTVGSIVNSTINKAEEDRLAGPAGVLATDTPEVRSAKIVVYKASGAKPSTTTAAEVKKTEKPVFKGEMSDAAAVAKFDLECQRYEIIKDVDTTDPVAVREANKKLAALAKSTEETTASNDSTLSAEEQLAGVTKSDTPAVRTARMNLLKAQQGSGQPAGGGEGGGATHMFNIQLSKEDRSALAEGDSIAKAAKASRGDFKLVG